MVTKTQHSLSSIKSPELSSYRQNTPRLNLLFLWLEPTFNTSFLLYSSRYNCRWLATRVTTSQWPLGNLTVTAGPRLPRRLAVLGARRQVSPRAGAVISAGGTGGGAGRRSSRLLLQALGGRRPGLPRWQRPPGNPGPRVREGPPATARAPRTDFSRGFPTPSPAPPGSRVGCARYGCAEEAPLAAASAPAHSLPAPPAPRAVGAPSGHSRGPSRPALLRPRGGGGSGGWGSAEAAAALGRAEHRGGRRWGSGRPRVLPAVRGPQARLPAGAHSRAPLRERGRGAGGRAPRTGAAPHPGRRCQGDGRCTCACASRSDPQGTSLGRASRCPRHLSAGRGGATETASPPWRQRLSRCEPGGCGGDLRDPDWDLGPEAPGVCACVRPDAGKTEDAVRMCDSLRGRYRYHLSTGSPDQDRVNKNPRKKSRAWQAESGGLHLLREGSPSRSGQEQMIQEVVSGPKRRWCMEVY